MSQLVENGANHSICSPRRALGREGVSLTKPHPKTTGLLAEAVQPYRLRSSKREWERTTEVMMEGWGREGSKGQASGPGRSHSKSICFLLCLTWLPCSKSSICFFCTSVSFEDTVTYTCPSKIFNKNEIN